MSPALVLGCLWVIAATLVALLPMRWQFGPGLILLVAAPVPIWLLGAEYGLPAAALAALALLSMYRHPLRHLAKRALGKKPEVRK